MRPQSSGAMRIGHWWWICQQDYSQMNLASPYIIMMTGSLYIDGEALYCAYVVRSVNFGGAGVTVYGWEMGTRRHDK